MCTRILCEWHGIKKIEYQATTIAITLETVAGKKEETLAATRNYIKKSLALRVFLNVNAVIIIIVVAIAFLCMCQCYSSVQLNFEKFSAKTFRYSRKCNDSHKCNPAPVSRYLLHEHNAF